MGGKEGGATRTRGGKIHMTTSMWTIWAGVERLGCFGDEELAGKAEWFKKWCNWAWVECSHSEHRERHRIYRIYAALALHFAFYLPSFSCNSFTHCFTPSWRMKMNSGPQRLLQARLPVKIAQPICPLGVTRMNAVARPSGIITL